MISCFCHFLLVVYKLTLVAPTGLHFKTVTLTRSVLLSSKFYHATLCQFSRIAHSSLLQPFPSVLPLASMWSNPDPFIFFQANDDDLSSDDADDDEDSLSGSPVTQIVFNTAPAAPKEPEKQLSKKVHYSLSSHQFQTSSVISVRLTCLNLTPCRRSKNRKKWTISTVS